MNRTALIISILLTALVLTIVGGVVYSVHNIQVAQAAQAAQAAQSAAASAQSNDANSVANQPSGDALQQALVDREAAYQKMIADANARLSQDQQNIQALQAQITALQNPTSQSPVAAAASGVSPENAAQIAAQYLGQSKIYSVETAAYNGATVYSVTFSSGAVVYVSLDGQILAVQPAPRHSSGSQVAASGGGEREHEGGGDD